MVAVDSNFLPLLLGHPTASRSDPSTKAPPERLQERIDLLIETLENNEETIIIATPVLHEFLMLAGDDGPKYLSRIEKDPLYTVESFDQLAAIELVIMRRKKAATHSQKARSRQTPNETKAKINFDRQIVAIAKVHKAHTIYSDDGGVRNFATENKIRVVGVLELPLPEPIAQMSFEDITTAFSSGDAPDGDSEKATLPETGGRDGEIDEEIL